jgi:hypothetical protein
MRRLIALVGLVAAAGCVDRAPTETPGGTRALSPSFSVGSEGAPPIVFNTQLRAEDEIPLPTTLSSSKGHAHLKVRADGTIESRLKINNIDSDVLRFCHIHWIDTRPTSTFPPGAGPVIWFLTPTNQNLQLDNRHFDFQQDADYVNNNKFGSDTPENAAMARTALLANPSEFYVNCHSNASPPGFIRGNLP